MSPAGGGAGGGAGRPGAGVFIDSAVRLGRRHSAPSIYLSPDPLHGVRPEGSGSRFWILQEEEDSDDEGAGEPDFPMPASESGESIPDAEILRDAMRAGYSIDEVRRAEILATNEVPPGFVSVDRGAGHVSHPRLLAQRVVDAVADLRSPSVKPWKGPLPKRRVSPRLSLGDIWVTDCTARFLFLGDSEGATSPSRGARAGAGDRRLSAVVTAAAESKVRGRKVCLVSSKSSRGPACWAGPREVAQERFGYWPQFKFLRGLGRLFENGGKPRRRNHLNGQNSAVGINN